ncbi:MAG: methionine adenosyltransferase [Gammaproteobacteria bacterium]|nr:methionine adenosyltransferase [Gammaproteobacteria bacterium]
MVEQAKPGHFYFASESVGEGHPDKVCDQVSDGCLDACIAVDPRCKVAMETACKSDLVCLLGEITHKGTQVNFEEVARKVCKEIGYTSKEVGLDCNNCQVLLKVEAQDANIANAVHGHQQKKDEDLGAGDQGIMFGYATDEWDTETLFPYSHYLANKICEVMGEKRHAGEIAWLRPDCKSQVIVEYKKEGKQIKPVSIYNVLISTQHDPSVDNETIRSTLTELVKTLAPADLLKDTKFVINPSGKFDVGGPAADAGLTGRKIIVDTYGGWAPHGGGAFSGKDPSKVDRSAAYYARYVAKSLVHNKLAHRCLVQVSYAIGLADPLSVHIDSYGSVKEGLTDEDLVKIALANFNFRPGNIIKELDLTRPIFQKSAKYGHFGRTDPDFTWEKPKENLEL